MKQGGDGQQEEEASGTQNRRRGQKGHRRVGLRQPRSPLPATSNATKLKPPLRQNFCQKLNQGDGASSSADRPVHSGEESWYRSLRKGTKGLQSPQFKVLTSYASTAASVR